METNQCSRRITRISDGKSAKSPRNDSKEGTLSQLILFSVTRPEQSRQSARGRSRRSNRRRVVVFVTGSYAYSVVLWQDRSVCECPAWSQRENSSAAAMLSCGSSGLFLPECEVEEEIKIIISTVRTR